jgi:hypothetical protein
MFVNIHADLNGELLGARQAPHAVRLAGPEAWCRVAQVTGRAGAPL